MNRHRRRVLTLGSVILATAIALGTRDARAQSAPPSGLGLTAVFRLPVEFGQGPLLANDAKDVRYSMHATVLPGVGYGILDVNAVAAGIWRNPYPACFTCTLDAGIGLRTSIAAVSALQGAFALRIAAEFEYQPRAQAMRAAVGIIPDLSSILRLGIWGGRDWASQAYYVDFTVAVDLMTLGDPVGAILRTGPMEDFGRGTR
jgi:hypothetical protein